MALKASVAVLAAMLMTAQTAFADDAAPARPPAQVPSLAPGQAAGLHQAQNGPPSRMIAIGGAIALGVLAVYLIAGTHYHVPTQKSASSTK
jgi:hypothetical protein